jgi:hypothetical protein
MKKRGYKVCWTFTSFVRQTCRTLSAKQHRNAREAAETVLMQNPGAVVRVVSPGRGGRGSRWRLKGLRAVRI